MQHAHACKHLCSGCLNDSNSDLRRDLKVVGCVIGIPLACATVIGLSWAFSKLLGYLEACDVPCDILGLLSVLLLVFFIMLCIITCYWACGRADRWLYVYEESLEAVKRNDIEETAF